MIISCAIILFIDVCDIEQESGFEWRKVVVLDKPEHRLKLSHLKKVENMKKKKEDVRVQT